MTFVRQPARHWHDEVPGARWFKADLHVHTIDDHPGGRASLPAALLGQDRTDPKILQAYAVHFLQGVARAGIQVLALTSHAVRTGSDPDTSAIWHIIDTWNSAVDPADHRPFRDKIYAVFPGFEPNVADGHNGVHLLFVFDPEIGRECFLRVFDAIMDGREPWPNGSLRMTTKDAQAVLATIDNAQSDTARSARNPWSYAVFAPHSDGEHGLFKSVKSQIVETFPCARLTGYELQKGCLPEDFSNDPGRQHQWDFIRAHGQAFYHATDAYKIGASDAPKEFEIGHRFTWLKLASPRIEALRQAFLASDSRLRIAYVRDENNQLVLRPDPPEALPSSRHWLRSLSVTGSASFFAGQTIPFNPDLTCIIGGSMSGKSTLLDGLRVATEAPLPRDPRASSQVQARGDNLSAGAAVVTFDTPGRPATESARERFPALYFTQSELQGLADDRQAVEELLSRLRPEATEPVAHAKARLAELAQGLPGLLSQRSRVRGEIATAAQNVERCERAQKALSAFAAAGVATVERFDRALARQRVLRDQLTAALEAADGLSRSIEAMVDPALTASEYRAALLDVAEQGFEPERPLSAILETQGAVKDALTALSADVARVGKALQERRAVERTRTQQELAAAGHGADALREFTALQRTAAQTENYRAALADLERQQSELDSRFQRDLAAMKAGRAEIRQQIQAVADEIQTGGTGKIRIAIRPAGQQGALADFFVGLKRSGVTTWWRDHGTTPLTPAALLEALDGDRLRELGFSPAVAATLKEAMTADRRDELLAIDVPDGYEIAHHVGPGPDDLRPLESLSGGRKVNVLLTLLLEAGDDRPLIIDQPEDQLDNRYLFETVLPVLRRLKGKRQVILATHNANIVVNGDADLVVQLDADKDHGRVACAGAIEEVAVKHAIVETVDGGKQAFDLRKAKYGF